MYRYAVIGRGLIGAATARHLSLNQNKIALIGQPEPQQPKTHMGAFASHYDSGRITRILHTDKLWAQIAQNSINRYQSLEKISGIPFYSPQACLFSSSAKHVDYIAQLQTVGKELDAHHHRLNTADLQQQFPQMHFASGEQGIYEPAPAGFIDPRRMLAAQIKASEDAGVQCIEKLVLRIEETPKHLIIHTHDQEILAENLVISTGAYTNHLLKDQLAYRVIPRTIVMAVLNQDGQQRLNKLPSLIHTGDDDTIEYLYVVPPTSYPDGSIRLKIGAAFKNTAELTTPKQIRNWFQSQGDTKEAHILLQALQEKIPDLHIDQVITSCCVYTETVSMRPYLGAINPRLFVATGGCGMAAKSADELGFITAHLMTHGSFPNDYTADQFQLHFKSS